MKNNSPIAIFTYNRPNHARMLFESLLNCARLDECDLHIFCDGLGSSEHAANVQASRQVVREFAPRLNAVRVIEHDKNLRLAGSIVYGVTELCAQYGRVIVLEDDLILHPFFLDFMLQALDRYQDEERVAQVMGFTFPGKLSTDSDAFFLPFTSSWGWATWQRAWSSYSPDVKPALELLDADPQLRFRFDLDGTYHNTIELRRISQDKLDTWDYQWYWSVFSANKFALFPRRSLVWQNGLDASGTHTKSEWYGLQPSLKKILKEKWTSPVSFPVSVQTNEIAFDNLKNFYRLSFAPTFFVYWRRVIKLKILRLVKKTGLPAWVIRAIDKNSK